MKVFFFWFCTFYKIRTHKARQYQGGRGVRHGAHLLPQTHQDNYQHAERFTQNTYWMLAEDLKLPKRGRNPPHIWVEQKEKKIKWERKESDQDQHSCEGAEKEERNPHHGKPPNWWGDHPRQRDIKATEKSAVAGLRRAKQRGSCKHHQYHHLQTPQPEMLRWGLDAELRL